MFDLNQIKVKVQGKGSKANIVVEPLPAGYGLTLGNALRRVLLSSIPGGAFYEVRFEGVAHPFTTIEGIKEDVVEILLNLKQVRLRVDSDEPVALVLEAKGKGQVTAGDIKAPAGVEIINKDQKIASLTGSKAKLSARLLAEKGYGYVPAEERESSKVGVIPLDSAFSPVRKVAYFVEETRVGQETDFDRLVLDIETDGSIEAQSAFETASSILASYFSYLAAGQEPPSVKVQVGEQEEEQAVPDKDNTKSIQVEDLNLSTRTKTSLVNGGVKTVAGLVVKTEEDLMALRGFGKKGLSEVNKELKRLGVSFKKEA